MPVTFFEKKVTKKALPFALRWGCGRALSRRPLVKHPSRGIPTSNPKSTILEYQNGTFEALVAALFSGVGWSVWRVGLIGLF